MNKFKLTIKQKIKFLSVGAVIIFLIYIFTFLLYSNGYKLGNDNFIRGFQLGIFSSFEGVIILKLINYRKILSNENRLYELFIIENDERNITIKNKTGSTASYIELFAILIATLIASFYNVTIFFTLLGVMIFAVICRSLLKYFYQKNL